MADEASAHEWVSQALESKWGVPEPRDLPRTTRALALQKAIGALLAVEELGEVAFAPDQRNLVAACFARFFDGVRLDGPPWRVSPTEELPSREEWVESTDVFR